MNYTTKYNLRKKCPYITKDLYFCSTKLPFSPLIQVIEVELAKLKVMVNDIQAHQSSVDTLNDAGRQIIEAEMGSHEASNTQVLILVTNSSV